MAVACPLSGTRLPLTRPDVSVGRDAANRLTLVDASVSLRHCVFGSEDGRVTIRDRDPGQYSRHERSGLVHTIV